MNITPNKIRLSLAAYIILAVVLRATGWMLPFEIRVWGMWLAGACFGYVYGRATFPGKRNSGI